MSESHNLQGALPVEAESGDEFDPESFVGEWTVFAGNFVIGDKAVILRKGDEFGLYACGQEGPLQLLIYRPGTRTLDSAPGDRPERSIAFWDTSPHNRQKH